MPNGWGGKRLGSGPRPQSRKQKWLGGNASKKPLTAVQPVSRPAPDPVLVASKDLPSPGVLTEDEAQYWALWAPLAAGRGFLTPDTIPGMVLLCQQARRAAAMWAEIAARGLCYESVIVDGSGQEHVQLKAHPLLVHWRALMGRVEHLQARYGMAADGRPVEVGPSQDQDESKLAGLLSIR